MVNSEYTSSSFILYTTFEFFAISFLSSVLAKCICDESCRADMIWVSIKVLMQLLQNSYIYSFHLSITLGYEHRGPILWNQRIPPPTPGTNVRNMCFLVSDCQDTYKLFKTFNTAWQIWNQLPPAVISLSSQDDQVAIVNHQLHVKILYAVFICSTTGSDYTCTYALKFQITWLTKWWTY